VKILAVETSGDACSAALWLNGEVAGRYEEQPRRHVELLLPMIRGLLAEADLRLDALDGIAFGAGPGSFTGVRIAVSAAQGLGLGAGLSLVAVSSLAALALAAADAGAECVLVARDARMGEVYAGAYRRAGAGLETVSADCLVPPQAVPREGEWWLAGDAWSRYAFMSEAMPGSATHTGLMHPRAQEVARLAAPRFAAGDTVPPRDAQPLYLRKRVAQPGP
jgi:tRNA threonylcarbamoyladenosine biosynthesis protein TsaB